MSTRNQIGLKLFSFLLLIIILKYFITRYIDDQGIFINLISEIVGVIITLYFVDKIISREEDKKKNELFSVAIRSLKSPLRRYISMWLSIYNSNEEKLKFELQNIDLKEFMLTDKFINQIIKRDFDDKYSELAVLGYKDPRPLKVQIPKILDHFKSDISRIIGYYSYAFNTNTIVLLQHFAADAHLYNIFYISQKIYIDHNSWFFSQDPENIKEHLKSLFELLDIYNSNEIGRAHV